MESRIHIAAETTKIPPYATILPSCLFDKPIFLFFFHRLYLSFVYLSAGYYDVLDSWLFESENIWDFAPLRYTSYKTFHYLINTQITKVCKQAKVLKY